MKARAFDKVTLADFAASFPTNSRFLRHNLANHPLLTLGAVATLASQMRAESCEHNAAVDLPLGITNDQTPANGLSVLDTIQQIEYCGSWVLLKNIEQHPAYAQLMQDVLSEISAIVEPVMGKMLRLEGFIFVSSPRAVTPLHFDPEYNILFQARGSKTMTLFPVADPKIISQEFFEQYFAGGPRNLPWDDSWKDRSTPISIAPGEAIFVPILAPHWVQTHDEVSISLSLTWRSEWSFRHADAHRFNRRLRQHRMSPLPPQLFPRDNFVKAYSERFLERFWPTKRIG